jgi:hypothetical protein
MVRFSFTDIHNCTVQYSTVQNSTVHCTLAEYSGTTGKLASPSVKFTVSQQRVAMSEHFYRTTRPSSQDTTHSHATLAESLLQITSVAIRVRPRAWRTSRVLRIIGLRWIAGATCLRDACSGDWARSPPSNSQRHKETHCERCSQKDRLPRQLIGVTRSCCWRTPGPVRAVEAGRCGGRRRCRRPRRARHDIPTA